MMKCSECGEIFDQSYADVKREHVGEFWGQPAYMNIDICPMCGSEEIYAATRCPICDEYYIGEDDYCYDCKSFLEASVTGYIGNMQLSLNLDYEEALKAVKYEIDRRIG